MMADVLREKVSFPVYQDSNNSDVWNLLGGGKDDIYIYDKCGRQTFYIPFPLSVIDPQQPIVISAIRSTAFDSLCGESCLLPEMESIITFDYKASLNHGYMTGNRSINATDYLDVEDIKKALQEENGLENNESSVIIEDVGDEFPFGWEQMNGTEIYNEKNFLENATVHFDIVNNTAEYNTTELPVNMTTSADEDKTAAVNTTEWPRNVTGEIYVTNKEEVEPFWDLAYDNYKNDTSRNIPLTSVQEVKPGMKGRCEEQYRQSCKDWEKKKLWHAHSCCSSSRNSEHEKRHCKHYGLKRCKKLQHLLKCCLGTAAVPVEVSLSVGGITVQEKLATSG